MMIDNVHNFTFVEQKLIPYQSIEYTNLVEEQLIEMLVFHTFNVSSKIICFLVTIRFRLMPLPRGE